jgi:hypothetical protein
MGLYWETGGRLGVNVAYGWPNDSGGSDLVIFNVLRSFSLR